MKVKIELTCWNDSYYTLWNQKFEGNPFFCDDSIVHFTEEFVKYFAQIIGTNFNSVLNILYQKNFIVTCYIIYTITLR
jgi:hypothetical protein